MRLRLTVVPRAERQVRAASRWWYENRPAARNLFREELDRGFELITTQPDVGPSVPYPDLPGIRRLHLSRIRYHLYYEVLGDTVKVLALWHTSRGRAPDL